MFFVVSKTGYFPQEVFHRGDESRYLNQTEFNHSVEIKTDIQPKQYKETSGLNFSVVSQK